VTGICVTVVCGYCLMLTLFSVIFLISSRIGILHSSYEHDKTHGNTKEKSVVSSLSGPSHLGHGTFTRGEYEIYLVPSSAACYRMRSLSAGTDGDPLDMDSNDDDVNINRSNTNSNSNSGIGASSTLLLVSDTPFYGVSFLLLARIHQPSIRPIVSISPESKI
jgi:hypothetical protein